MIEDVEDEVDELSNSDCPKATVGVFDEIDNGNAGVLFIIKFC